MVHRCYEHSWLCISWLTTWIKVKYVLVASDSPCLCVYLVGAHFQQQQQQKTQKLLFLPLAFVWTEQIDSTYNFFFSFSLMYALFNRAHSDAIHSQTNIWSHSTLFRFSHSHSPIELFFFRISFSFSLVVSMATIKMWSVCERLYCADCGPDIRCVFPFSLK